MGTDLDGLVEIMALKALDRAGWIRRGVARPESVAAHSWGVAWLVLQLLPTELSRERALAYAIVHDLAEVRVGDITPHDGISTADKAGRETTAMHAMATGWPRAEQTLTIWQAYEAQADPEARFVRELDRLDMAIQALAYARCGHEHMDEFVQSARQAVRHPSLVPVLDAISAEIRRRSR